MEELGDDWREVGKVRNCDWVRGESSRWERVVQMEMKEDKILDKPRSRGKRVLDNRESVEKRMIGEVEW